MEETNLTINSALLIELLRLSKPFEDKNLHHNSGAENHINAKFVHSLTLLLHSKNEDFDIDVFRSRIADPKPFACEEEAKEILLGIIKPYDY